MKGKKKKYFIRQCLKSALDNHLKYIKTEKIDSQPFGIHEDLICFYLAIYEKRCIKTDVIMRFGSYKDFAMSIDRINNKQGYTENNIQLVCREANIQGMDITCGQTTKNDFIKVYQSVIAYVCHQKYLYKTNKDIFENNLTQTSKQNGVTAHWSKEKNLYNKQCNDYNLKTILSVMCSHANEKDQLKGRIGPKITVDMMICILRKYDYRCVYSKLPLEISISSKYRLSFERLDNRKTHGEPGNCIPVIRFLNCPDRSCRSNAKGILEDDGRGFSLYKLMQMVLQQRFVELTLLERYILEHEIFFYDCQIKNI